MTNESELLPYEYQLIEPSDRAISIHQDPSGSLSGGIGATVWDCALVLGKMLEQQASVADESPLWKNMRVAKRVIELGSGTGILGLVVATLLNDPGCDLVLTDQRCALDLLRRNAGEFQSKHADIQTKIRVAELNWLTSKEQQQQTPTGDDRFDVILIADCVHWPELFGPLISTVRNLSHPETLILLGYEKRDFAAEAEFFRQFGAHFRFRPVPAELCHPDWTSEDDIFLFQAWPRKPDE